MRHINKTILGALILTFGLGLIACDGNSAKKTDNKSQQDENKVVIGGQTLEKGNITAKVFKKGNETGIAGAKVTFVINAGDITSFAQFITKETLEGRLTLTQEQADQIRPQVEEQFSSCKEIVTNDQGIANCKAPKSFMNYTFKKVDVTVAKDTDLGINAIVNKELDLEQSTNIDIEIQ